MDNPLATLSSQLMQTTLVRYYHRLYVDYPDVHMKDMTQEESGPGRRIRLDGRWVTNFGSDSFLGLDKHPAVLEALFLGIQKWGSHNGCSRAFSSVLANEIAEARLASWLKAPSVLIFPSVTLTNLGALPALLTRHDALVVDQYAHHCIHQGAKIAKSQGIQTATFQHNDPDSLEMTLAKLRPFRHAIIAIDGVYSMSGTLPPLVEFQRIAKRNHAVLYVDDAHGTGVLGERGRGTVLDALGNYDNTLVVGSLSKGLSCFGGFIACNPQIKFALKVRSGPMVFGGPVPPPYLEAISTVMDIMESEEGLLLLSALRENMEYFNRLALEAGLFPKGGIGAIASLLLGDEMATMTAGKLLFERGYFVQSVIFPAVPHHQGILRVQITAIHTHEHIKGLVEAIASVVEELGLSGNSKDSPNQLVHTNP